MTDRWTSMLDKAEERIAELEGDLEKTAQERDAAERTAEARKQLLTDSEARQQDMRTQWLTAVGALRETDAHVDRLMAENKRLRSELETAGREYNALADELDRHVSGHHN